MRRTVAELLKIEGLGVDFPVAGHFLSRRRVNVLEDVSLTVSTGETLALVGESGSGKTTLARSILGLQAARAGRIWFDGNVLHSTQSYAAARKSLAMMFQDPVGSLSPRMQVGSLLTEPFVIHGLAIKDRKAKAHELLNRAGLNPELARRYPHELSGGQARRVGVARALALNPKLVIADEPTAGLDVSVQGEILNLMAEIKKQMGLSYLIITHNLAVVRHVSDRTAVMYLGRLVETGPTRDVFRRPLHPYSRSLIASEPKPDPRLRRNTLPIQGEIPGIANRPKGCEFHTRCPMVQERCRREAPVLRAVSPERFVRCHFAVN
jgi:peptide/nickel transport system ATP-binding protein